MDCGHEEEVNILDNRISELTQEKIQIQGKLKETEADYKSRLAILAEELNREKYARSALEAKLNEVDQHKQGNNPKSKIPKESALVLTQEATESNDKLPVTKSEYESRLAMLSDELSHEKHARNELEQKVSILEKVSKGEQDEKRPDNDKKLLKLNMEIKNLKDESELLKDSIQNFENQTERLQTELGSWKDKYLVKENEKQGQDQQLLILKDECEHDKESIRIFKNQIEELQTELGSWKEKYIIVEHEKQEQDQQLLTLGESLKNGDLIRGEIGETENVLTILKQEIIKAQEENSALKLSCVQREDEISELKASSSLLSEKLLEKETQLSEKGELCGKNEQDLLNSKTVLDSLSAKLLEKTEECQTLADMIQKHELTIRDLEDNCKTLETVSDDNNTRLISAEESLSAEKENLVKIEAALYKTQQEHTKKDEQISKLHETITTSNKRLEDLKSDSQRKDEYFGEQKKFFDSKMEELNRDLSRKEGECNGLKEQFEKQNLEIDSLRQSLKTQETKFNETLNSSSKEIQEMLEELEVQKSRCSELNDVLKLKEDTENNLNETLNSFRQEINEKELRIGELHEVKISLELELSNLKEKQPSLREEILQKEESIQSFGSREDDLFGKDISSDDPLKKQEESLQTFKEKVDCLSQERVNLQDEINRLREFEMNAKSYEEKIQKCSKEIEEMKAMNGKSNVSSDHRGCLFKSQLNSLAVNENLKSYFQQHLHEFDVSRSILLINKRCNLLCSKKYGHSEIS